ncbi:MAG: hypothetical protein EPN94_05285 [Nitrospirae bacterium]|nr:MAG: hypothetical protein EPN94_05285 [Nitrospirota bacterium]
MHSPSMPSGKVTCIEYEGIIFFLFDNDVLNPVALFAKTGCAIEKPKAKPRKFSFSAATEITRMESIMARMR